MFVCLCIFFLPFSVTAETNLFHSQGKIQQWLKARIHLVDRVKESSVRSLWSCLNGPRADAPIRWLLAPVHQLQASLWFEKWGVAIEHSGESVRFRNEHLTAAAHSDVHLFVLLHALISILKQPRWMQNLICSHDSN